MFVQPLKVVDTSAAAFELVKAHNDDKDQTELLSQPSKAEFVRRPKEGLKMRAALHSESVSTQCAQGRNAFYLLPRN